VRTRVVAVDIGSVRTPSRFAWAAYDAPGLAPIAVGNNPEAVADVVAAGIADGWRAALLLEAPMAVPVPDVVGWRSLGTARSGEGNRAWSAGAGAGVLATGLAQTAWILQAVAGHRVPLTVTTQADRWRRGQARLLLAEAFVSGTGKPVPVSGDQHVADAAAAGKEFVRRLDHDAFDSDVQCAPATALNLLAATAMWAGLTIDRDELRSDVLVVKVKPVPMS
jgi:hypothetical protein